MSKVESMPLRVGRGLQARNGARTDLRLRVCPDPLRSSARMATVEPDVHVWVRTAVDWRDEHGPGGQVNDAIRSRVELWNALFTLSYHEFRFEISEIARLNLSRIRGATTTAAWDEIPDGAVVLPVDDDDWFAPDTAEALDHASRPRRARLPVAGDLPRAADGIRSSRAPRAGPIPRRRSRGSSARPTTTRS